MNVEQSPLSDHLRELLEHDRAITNAAPERARRDVLRGLERELGLDLTGGGRDEPAAPTGKKPYATPRGTGLRMAHLVGASALSFAAGIGVGVAVSRPSQSKLAAETGTPPVASVHERAIYAPAPSVSASPDLGAVTAPASSPRPPATHTAPRSSSSPSTTTRGASAEGSGSRERTLLDRAQTAIARGDVTAASSALDEHERAYRSGELAEERDFLRIQESLRSGRRDEAVLRARAFRANRPTSVLNPAIDRLLAAPNP